MKKNLKYIFALIVTGAAFFACNNDEDYSLGDLDALSNLKADLEKEEKK